MYASTLPRSNWLRRASIRLAWYRHMPASSLAYFMVTERLWHREKCDICLMLNKILSFLLHDAMHKRGYCRHAVSVSPSVCPPVTFVSCAKTNKDIFEISSPSGSQAILVFRAKRDGANPTETPLTVASNARGYEKMTIFDQYLALSEKRL